MQDANIIKLYRTVRELLYRGLEGSRSRGNGKRMEATEKEKKAMQKTPKEAIMRKSRSLTRDREAKKNRMGDALQVPAREKRSSTRSLGVRGLGRLRKTQPSASHDRRGRFQEPANSNGETKQNGTPSTMVDAKEDRSVGEKRRSKANRRVNIGLSGLGQTRATFSLGISQGRNESEDYLQYLFLEEDGFLKLFPINTSW